jgi:hypothetical protein
LTRLTAALTANGLPLGRTNDVIRIREHRPALALLPGHYAAQLWTEYSMAAGCDWLPLTADHINGFDLWLDAPQGDGQPQEPAPARGWVYALCPGCNRIADAARIGEVCGGKPNPDIEPCVGIYRRMEI